MPTQRCECGAKYRFPESALGKRAKCKKCGAVFTLTGKEDDGTIPIAESGFEDELSAAADRAETGPVSAAYLPTAESRGRLGPAVIEDAVAPASYGRSLLLALLSPASGGNLATFIIVSGVVFISNALLPWALCLGMIGQIVILGWFSAFRFSVIQEAAAGERELPALTLIEGAFEGVIIPLCKWLGSWAVVLLPAYVYFLVLLYLGVQTGTDMAKAISGGIDSMLSAATREMIPFVILVCAGVFAWPMLVLCVALGGLSTLTRVDLMVVTVVRTLPVYIFTVAVVLGADLLNGLLGGLVVSGSGHGLGAILGLKFVAAAIGVYFEIVAMQVIGLYYHHFKERFAWDWG